MFDIINLLVHGVAILILTLAFWPRDRYSRSDETTVVGLAVILAGALIFGWATAVGFFYNFHRLFSFFWS